jgi:hypothetical protein
MARKDLIMKKRFAATSMLSMAALAIGLPASASATSEDASVAFQTQAGKVFCYVSPADVGCQAPFTNTPIQDGVRTNGVRLGADGTVEYLVGDLGDLPEPALEYSSFSAAGWTIDAAADGTRFTNDATGHGMFVNVDRVETY